MKTLKKELGLIGGISLGRFSDSLSLIQNEIYLKNKLSGGKYYWLWDFCLSNGSFASYRVCWGVIGYLGSMCSKHSPLWDVVPRNGFAHP